VRSRDVISCHVKATSCELQPCWSSNAPKTRFIRLLQPLPGKFRSNDVISGSLSVTWGDVTSFPVTWWPPPASYSPAGAQTYQKLDIRLLQPLRGDFRSNDVISGSLSVTWDRMTSFPVTWLPPPASYSPGGAQTFQILYFYAFHSYLQVTSRQIMSSVSLPVTWGHVTSFPITWLPPLASNRLVGLKRTQNSTYVFYSHFQVTSRQMMSPLGHFRWREARDVISCHVNATSCELQPCRSSNVPKTRLIRLLQPLPGDFVSNDITCG